MGPMPSRVRLVAAWALLTLAAPAATELHAQSLLGSRASVDIQNEIARAHDYTFLRNGAQVKRFVEAGYLVPIRGNRDFDLHAVSYPYARPEVALFVERLASQYRAACGEKLVVTSLTRPQSAQPANASARSVHPTGMAVDLRRSNDARCRSWLESVLLSLEKGGVLEATRERRPPHYHIALFPKPYAQYVERRAEADTRSAESQSSDTRVAEAAQAQADLLEYQVRRGDSLWTIARAHGVSVAEIRTRNELRGSRIYAGQVLQVPVSR